MKFAKFLEEKGISFSISESESPAELRNSTRLRIIQFNEDWGHVLRADSEFTWEYLYGLVEDERCEVISVEDFSGYLSGSATAILDHSDKAVVHIADLTEFRINKFWQDFILIPDHEEWIFVNGHEPYAEHTFLDLNERKAISLI